MQEQGNFKWLALVTGRAFLAMKKPTAYRSGWHRLIFNCRSSVYGHERLVFLLIG